MQHVLINDPYRVTIQLVQNLPLTSKHKFCFGLARPGQGGTFVLKSTGVFAHAEWSPCITHQLTKCGRVDPCNIARCEVTDPSQTSRDIGDLFTEAHHLDWPRPRFVLAVWVCAAFGGPCIFNDQGVFPDARHFTTTG